jgi:uncharacterized surface protein with fasciclin (FAS1) repeats
VSIHAAETGVARMNKNLAAIALILAISSFASSRLATPQFGDDSMSPYKTIFKNADELPNTSKLASALKAAGYVNALDGKDKFTVFAPTDLAFEALPGDGTDLLFQPQNKDQLKKILGCHIIVGDTKTDTIRKMVESGGGTASLSTVGGCTLQAKYFQGSLSLEDEQGNIARITTPDVAQSNGVIHFVNKVILPVDDRVPIIRDKGNIQASRLFAGPGQYPPTDFAAYGILAFRSRASSFDLERHLMICEAYVRAVPSAVELGLPHKDQMVTVWPIENDVVARSISTVARDKVCAAATQSYGLVTAQTAILHAEKAGQKLEGRSGPFLLAWSPPKNKGEAGSVVLMADLSRVSNYQQAVSIMGKWVSDIERNPSMWANGGWNAERVRIAIQQWLDYYGPNLLIFIK